MHCQACGASNQTEHRFCLRCGAALPSGCPSCGLPNSPDSKYCSHCGGQLPIAPEERKRVTLLFADIKESAELIQGREQDPEEVKGILSPAVRIMRAAAERYGGTVDRIPLGDAIMATFGAPQALEDHAVRACLAALSLQDRIRRWNEAQQRSGGYLEYHVRVGLSSGEVLTSDAQGGGPYGEATILASRMETLAPPGKILLTKSTWLLARGFVRAVPLGAQKVRGKKEPLEVYQLEGAEARTRFNARQNQGLTQFVGREAELDLLGRALRRAAAGDGQVVTVTGGPGIGKSRLIHHFLHLGLIRLATILEASAELYDRDSVYQPIANLLRSLLNVVSSDPTSTIQAKIEAKLSQRSDLVLAACALLDLPYSGESTAWTELDPVQKRRQISEAVRELILEEPRRSPLVLVFEDLQWLDDGTRALVDDLIGQVRNRAVLLVLSSREPTAVQGSHCQILELQALDPLRAQELLTHLVGNAPEIARLRTLMLHRADDTPTPLFLEETVSSLVEQGVLQGVPGAYRLEGDPETLEREIPHKVEEVLAARIDRLTRDHKEVLETASVIGMEAPLELLCSVTKIDVDRLLRILRELETADLMYESLTSGQPEFRFKHTLTREVAATRIPTSVRRSLHARTLLAIESQYQHRREEWIDRLADHASRAGLWQKASEYCAEACRRAIERSSNRHAVKFFEKGLAALKELPDTDDRRKAEIDLRLTTLNAMLPLGEQEQIAQQLRQAKELAVLANDAIRLAKIEVQLTFFLWETGSHQAALESGATALRLATENGLDRVSLAARLHIGIVHHALGELQQALEMHRTVLDELVAAGLERRRFNWAAYPSVITRAFCADCCISLGDFEKAAQLIDAGKALTEEIGHPYSRTLIETVAARYHLARDEPAVAARLLAEAERRARQDEIRTMLPDLVAGLGTALTRSGRVTEGLQILKHALDRESWRNAGNYGFYYLRMAIAEAHSVAGQTDEASNRAEQAEQLARHNHEQAHLAQALYLFGAINASRAPAVAEKAYLEALDLARHSEMRPLTADCCFGLAEIERRRGRREANQRLDEAKTLFLELGLERRAQRASLQRLT
jgi:class 3 adenylate cyclase/tetratricopeptide (TPR) repeat protein